MSSIHKTLTGGTKFYARSPIEPEPIDVPNFFIIRKKKYIAHMINKDGSFVTKN